MSIRTEGREVPVGPPLRRLLLALLVSKLGQVAPTEVLIEELWPGESPKKPVATLQSHISHLRGVLDPLAGRDTPSVLRHQAPGYVLLLPPSKVDVHCFEQLVDAGHLALRRGDAVAACATLTDALALWQGPPYLGFDTSPSLADESARMEQLRLTALEYRAEARLYVGDAEQVVTELDGEVRRHPMRERLVGHLMTALFALGRQAEALAVYDRTRDHLVEELGVETSGELQQIHVAILRQELNVGTAEPQRGDESPAAPATAVRTGQPEQGAGHSPLREGSESDRPTHPSSFVGRACELGRLVNEAAGVHTGHEHVSCVVGPLGIGKTHLLTEFAARMTTDHQDVEVVQVHALPDQGVPPLWLWTQVLRRLSTTRSAAFREAVTPPFEALIAPLLTCAGQQSGPDRARTRFLRNDAVCEVLRTLAAQRPLVLCVDDLHFADDASLELLEMLARRRYGWRIGLIVAAWDWKVTVDDRLCRTIAEMLRGPRAGVLRLTELPRHSIAALVRARLGPAAEAEHIESVYRQSQGNPYLAHRSLMSCAFLRTSGDRLKGAYCLQDRTRLLESLRLLFARIPERGRRVVHLCAVLGSQVDLSLLRRAATGEPVDAVLDQLLREGLLREDQHSLGRVHFVSEPVREALVETLTPEERQRIRERIAAALPAAEQGRARVAEMSPEHLHQPQKSA
ncbi:MULTISPECIES: BTAD domain-containing putative transcriptional regulator [unclassified Streptomyces]|uniref:BTAD domain-containing putative transcriptional regulator n=1 Tax=unclassified Streptomyces TaxID=2593676 RepID=UPI0014868B4C|nr:BTAD domain-containing putative transcriptional regulator [Streptomyces sp. DASNCL29]